MTEYITRAEQIITVLRGAGETPSKGLMMAIVMRGLPEKYKPFTLILTHGLADMKEFKAKLGNFMASEYSDPITELAAERVLKAWAAPKKNTRPLTELVCCRFSKSTGHTDKVCRKKKECGQSFWCTWP